LRTADYQRFFLFTADLLLLHDKTHHKMINRKKSIESLMKEANAEGGHTLKRTLSASSLIALGIGAIIGAGLFVRTAAASADHAGPAVLMSFIVAAIGCALAGLCYAEFASSIPIAGSAYTYSYATMGELVAWIIGWDLVAEYALGAATVAIAWSEYLNKLLEKLGGSAIPFQFCHSPFEVADDGTRGLINLPAIFIIAVLTLILIRGAKESALVNGIVVVIKVSIVVVFIGIGWGFMKSENHTPMIAKKGVYLNTKEFHKSFYTYEDSTLYDSTGSNARVITSAPEKQMILKQATEKGSSDFSGGWMGILAGAGVVFFAFIGFDAVSTAAQEAKNPKRDMPIGILGSLAICTVLYILFSYVLTGVGNFSEFHWQGREASVAYAIENHMPGYSGLSTAVTIAILAGFSSVILVMLMGQSRVFYSMSKDGLIPPIFAKIHPQFQTPYKSNIILGIGIAGFAAFLPGHVVGDMTSIGTLFAFVLVSIGVIILRKNNPEMKAGFRTPLVPLVPIAGALVCLAMIYGLGWENWARLAGWMGIGFLIYFGYGMRNAAKLNGDDKKKS
jgi:basic amino acid/polyamine antiporter, APA family